VDWPPRTTPELFIKTSNRKTSFSRKTDHLKTLDFGLAKLTQP
jgi:hypothetical protein